MHEAITEATCTLHSSFTDVKESIRQYQREKYVSACVITSGEGLLDFSQYFIHRAVIRNMVSP